MPRRYLEKDILPHIGSKPIRDITAEDVRSVIWRKKEQGFDAAAGQVRGLLKRMFDYALICGLIQANPVMALPIRHVYRAAARERALTPDEARQFLRAMQTSNIRRQFKIAFQLILMTLVRKSELMLAQWKDVHLDEGEWHIPVENSKTGKPHIAYRRSHHGLSSVPPGSLAQLPARAARDRRPDITYQRTIHLEP
ncbi:tyrosine-type recombinase/integrase [Paracandidimonas lactea]|uniref:tyrosine-type recombinase/integrase n=1 Tax=Paracandidimonas lactea TaxID=2895524 RepID=UPI003F715CB6